MLERPKRRLNFLAFALAFLCLFILSQLVRIQFFTHQELMAKGRQVRTRQSVLSPVRGRVWDRSGHLLVGNLVQYDITAAPALISDAEKVAGKLDIVLEVDKEELVKELSSDLAWVMVKRAVPQELGDQIAAQELVGISIEPVWRRAFPEGTLAAHLLGFVNAENKGYYGIEGYYDGELRGQAGIRVGQQDPWNEVIPLSLAKDEPPQQGVDLVLTLDRNVQALVEEELALALGATGAKSGVIIVMNPRTGAILAMAAAPVYDPNRYWETRDTRLFANPAISGEYEPGSVFKVVVMAVALENRAVSLDSTFYDEGQIEVGGQIVRNATRQAYGYVTLSQVLINSLNVEMAKISGMLGPEKFYQGIRAFGVGHRTGVDLEGEAVGKLRVPGDWEWHESDLATNAFGQGLAVTPLQMITAVAAIANDGILMQPYMVAEKRYADGRVEQAQPAPVGWAVSRETAHLVTEMMAETVEQGIKLAQVPGYRVAGKTGTAQLPTPLGYDEQKTIASFVGFVPVDDPQVIVLIRLDEPTSSQWGAQTAAPAFARMAERLFVFLEIPPDAVRLAMAGSQ
jgi:cell division protein FtsI (penicillin-binding protein 3)